MAPAACHDGRLHLRLELWSDLHGYGKSGARRFSHVRQPSLVPIHHDQGRAGSFPQKLL